MQIDACGLGKAALHAAIAQTSAATSLVFVVLTNWKRVHSGPPPGMSWLAVLGQAMPTSDHLCACVALLVLTLAGLSTWPGFGVVAVVLCLRFACKMCSVTSCQKRAGVCTFICTAGHYLPWCYARCCHDMSQRAQLL